jgi:hypothetical protein
MTPQGGIMSFIKLSMAIALFVTSITFQEHIMTNGSHAEVSWSATVSSNQVFANVAREAAYMEEAMLY